MHGYSDRINHAFAFAAKYYNALAPVAAGMDFLAHPANVAVILTRYGCEQVTIVAGILHHVLEESPPEPVAGAGAEDRGQVRAGRARRRQGRARAQGRPPRRRAAWQPCKQEYLDAARDAPSRGRSTSSWPTRCTPAARP